MCLAAAEKVLWPIICRLSSNNRPITDYLKNGRLIGFADYLPINRLIPTVRKKQVNELTSRQETEEESSSEEDVYFLGEVVHLDTINKSGNKPWTADIKVNETNILFKIDSGADVTVKPLTVYQQRKLQSTLKSTGKVLMGPCNYKMNCIGTFTSQLRHEDKTTTE